MPRLDARPAVDLVEETLLGGGLACERPGDLGGFRLGDAMGWHGGPDADDRYRHDQSASTKEGLAFR